MGAYKAHPFIVIKLKYDMKIEKDTRNYSINAKGELEYDLHISVTTVLPRPIDTIDIEFTVSDPKNANDPKRDTR